MSVVCYFLSYNLRPDDPIVIIYQLDELCVCFAMGRGLTLLSRTESKHPVLRYVKVESGAVVHVGIRDIIVIVERRKTALTTIVNTTTTKAETETARSFGSIPEIASPVCGLAASDGRGEILQMLQ